MFCLYFKKELHLDKSCLSFSGQLPHKISGHCIKGAITSLLLQNSPKFIFCVVDNGVALDVISGDTQLIV
jgi:hypothetical protein